MGGIRVFVALGDFIELVLNADEGIDHVGVEVGGTALEDDLYRTVMWQSGPVHALADQRVVDISHGHQAG